MQVWVAENIPVRRNHYSQSRHYINSIKMKKLSLKDLQEKLNAKNVNLALEAIQAGRGAVLDDCHAANPKKNVLA